MGGKFGKKNPGAAAAKPTSQKSEEDEKPAIQMSEEDINASLSNSEETREPQPLAEEEVTPAKQAPGDVALQEESGGSYLEIGKRITEATSEHGPQICATVTNREPHESLPSARAEATQPVNPGDGAAQTAEKMQPLDV